MLIGQYTHTMDDKSRLSLPSKFRKELGKTVVLTRGLDRSLFIYSVTEWKKFSEQLSMMPMGQADSRAFSRFLLGGAVETTVDKSGRILVPDFLKSFAKLSSKVMVVGVHNRVELWNEEEWASYTEAAERDADKLAERLVDVGMM